MTTVQKIYFINCVLEAHFQKDIVAQPILAKTFMPAFIEAGVFINDVKEGKPIRDILRKLDQSNDLHLIPYVIPVRKAQNTNWYFGPINTSTVKVPISVEPSLKVHIATATKPSIGTLSKSRSHSDECYVLDLCDEILQQTSERQYRFSFLQGDSGTLLPVDGYYEPLNLAVEYNERQHTEAVKLFDKRITVSGVTRGEQRKIYDLRKRQVLPEHGIAVITLSYSDFNHTAGKRLVRDKEKDILVVRDKLKSHI